MPYCTGKGLSRPRWRVRRSKSRCVALTSSSKCTGFPDSRVRTKTILITTSMLSSVCSTRPTRYASMRLPFQWLHTHDGDAETPGRGDRIAASVAVSPCRPVAASSPLVRHTLVTMCHIFPVVQPQVPGNQRPFPHARPYSHDRVHRPDVDRRHILVEPRPQFVAHEPHPRLDIGFTCEPVEERIKRRVLHQQGSRRLGMGNANQALPGLRGHEPGGKG